jgi:hypothetical protein
MILPENCQAGDLVGIFSTDGRTYRGSLTVREVSEDFISFTAMLPPGTQQGDILVLIRRRDEYQVRLVSEIAIREERTKMKVIGVGRRIKSSTDNTKK